MPAAAFRAPAAMVKENGRQHRSGSSVACHSCSSEGCKLAKDRHPRYSIYILYMSVFSLIPKSISTTPYLRKNWLWSIAACPIQPWHAGWLSGWVPLQGAEGCCCQSGLRSFEAGLLEHVCQLVQFLTKTIVMPSCYKMMHCWKSDVKKRSSGVYKFP